MAATRNVLVTSSTLGLFLWGCVPQEKYDSLLTSYRSQEQQLISTQGELDTIRTNESRLRSQLAQAAADLESAHSLRSGQGADLDKLLADYEAMLTQIANLEGGPLPESVNEALSALAAQYPDVMTFDAKRGMLRFSSDFTFDLGSANLKPGTAAVLGKVAGILNSPEATNFEVVVVGHTDNVPIRRSSTAAQHPTNLHLSAHRAITVRDALVHDGVAGNRFEVAGYGEYRPVVANGARGAEQNRRVEVFLTPLLIPLADVKPAPSPSASPAPAAATTDDEPTK